MNQKKTVKILNQNQLQGIRNLNMASQYFGFDDEEPVEVVDTVIKQPPTTTCKTPSRAPSSNKMSISEIHALLNKDSTANESTLNSSVNDSSFYADDDTSICQSQLNSTMEESFSVDDSLLNNITIVNGKPRKIIKAERKTRKVLGSIQSNENPSIESTPVRNYKKRAPRSATKNKENQPPKRMKTSKKNILDENYDELAEEMNKRFQEIENFQLVVE